MKKILLATGVIAAVAVTAIAYAQMRSLSRSTISGRAESDLYFGNAIKDAAGSGKFHHRREPACRSIIRPSFGSNRDTLYSAAVFDLDAGPVTITLPDAGERFMSLQVINEDHYVAGGVLRRGHATRSTRKTSARAMSIVGIRTLVDPADPEDVKEVHALQDAIKVEQAGVGKFEVPNWDPGQPEEGARCAARPRLDHARLQERIRHEGRGRSGPPSDRHSARLGRQSRQGCHLSQRHPAEERRHDRLQAGRQGRARRRLLVGQPLQRRRLLREERVQRLFDQQHHGRRRATMARSPSSSAAATARCQTACPS